MPLQAGDLAPDFTVHTDAGKDLSLTDARRKTVVLYFYPRADTAGLTTEACGIRDDFAGFERIGALVLGCSPDTVQAQAAFKEKNALPFTLLADADNQIAEKYGVWRLKQRPNGEEFMGVVRTTFLIGPDGVVQRVFEQVDPALHAKELLDALGA